MARYRRYNRYSDYYDDYNEEDPIAGLILLGLFYIVYKYFTDRATFIHWLVYGVLIVGVLLSGYIFIKIWKNKKAKKIFAEIKSVPFVLKKALTAKTSPFPKIGKSFCQLLS